MPPQTMPGPRRCARTYPRVRTALPPPRWRRGCRASPPTTSASTPFSDPSVLWLKAQLLRSSATVERASRPITNLQVGAYVALAAGWALLLRFKWSALQAWLHGFTPAALVTKAAGATATASISATMIIALIVLASLSVMVALHQILAEE